MGKKLVGRGQGWVRILLQSKAKVNDPLPQCISHYLFLQKILKSRPPWVAKKGANTSDSTAMSLMRMFRDGPDVSFSGSPMVSPITAALCGSEPFGPRVLACSEAPAYTNTTQNLHYHSRLKKLLIHPKETQVKRITSLIFDKLLTSIYFLALSHAPPVLEADIAIC